MGVAGSMMWPGVGLLLAAALAGCASDGDPPAAEPSFYNSLASADAKVDAAMAASMISGYRGNNGLSTVRIDPELMKLAQVQAQAMAARDKVDHDVVRDVRSRLRSSGYDAKIAAERMLMGIGIAPNTNEIGLDALGIALERGFIKVNGMMQTNVEGIYAIGDCVPTPALAHVASAEGIVAAEHIAGHHPPAIDYEKIPACTYCNPEVASIGLSEATARERGYDVKIGKFPFSANGKATILGQRNGFVKIVADKQYDEVLGVHIIGPRATELIAEGGVALSHEATSESLMRTIHAHPTLYEALGEAEHAAAEGAAIHI